MAIICKSTTIKTVKVQNSNGTTTEMFSIVDSNGNILYDKITATLSISYVKLNQYSAGYQTFKWQTAHKLSAIKIRPFYTNEVTGVTVYLTEATNANSGEHTLQLPVNTDIYDDTDYTYTVGIKFFYPNNSYATTLQYSNVIQTTSVSGSGTVVI